MNKEYDDFILSEIEEAKKLEKERNFSPFEDILKELNDEEQENMRKFYELQEKNKKEIPEDEEAK